MIHKKIISVEQFTNNDMPDIVYFIQSGFQNKIIMLTEDPAYGPECNLISNEEYLEWNKNNT